MLGGEVEVPTLEKLATFHIPAETQNGQLLRLAGQGMPREGDPSARGDLYARVHVVVPSHLSSAERRLFQRFRQMRAKERKAA